MKRQSGLSYIELMLATLLISLTLVPMMESLQPGLQATAWHERQSEIHYALTGTMETLLAEPFTDLDAAATAAGDAATATSYSNLLAAVPYSVFISRYDVDNADADGDAFTGGENDILWLRVVAVPGGQAYTTLLSRY